MGKQPRKKDLEIIKMSRERLDYEKELAAAAEAERILTMITERKMIAPSFLIQIVDKARADERQRMLIAIARLPNPITKVAVIKAINKNVKME